MKLRKPTKKKRLTTFLMIFKHAYYYGHVAKKQHISKIEQLKKLALFGASFSFVAINYLEKSNYFSVR